MDILLMEQSHGVSQSKDLPSITPKMATANTDYLPYKRDEKLVRNWAVPGMQGLEHRVGGLEKENETGNVSYDSDNHQMMVKQELKKWSELLILFQINN